MQRKALNFLLFGIAVAALLAALRLMHWAPTALQAGLLQRYNSVEEVKAKLNIRHVYAPAYFPLCFRWPPALIIAQTRPYTAVVMEFMRTDGDDICLVVAQTEVPRSPPRVRISLAEVRESVRHSLKGRPAFLETGLCDDGGVCSRISWEEDGYRILIIGRSAPAQLEKIAESVIPFQSRGSEK